MTVQGTKNGFGGDVKRPKTPALDSGVLFCVRKKRLNTSFFTKPLARVGARADLRIVRLALVGCWPRRKIWKRDVSRWKMLMGARLHVVKF